MLYILEETQQQKTQAIAAPKVARPTQRSARVTCTTDSKVTTSSSVTESLMMDRPHEHQERQGIKWPSLQT